MSNYLLFFEYVAESLATDDVGCIRSEFLAETGDMDDNSVVGDDDSVPDAVHQLLTRENLSAVREQQA